MPRNGSGTFTLASAAFVPNTTISSASVNADFSDIATGLTGSISSDGQTTVTGAIKFATGTAALPSITFTAQTTTGIYFPGTGKVGISTLGGTGGAIFDGTAIGTGQTGNQFYLANGALINPVGTVQDYAGATAPTGWLLCDGSSKATATYPELFTVIGYAYGGAGASFSLPDCRGRFTAGRDDMGGSAANRITAAGSGITGTALGATGGSETVVLITANLASHTHTVAGSTFGMSNDHTHTQTGSFTTGTESAAHTHAFTASVGNTVVATGGGGAGAPVSAGNTGTESAAHTHDVSLSGQTGTVSADHSHSMSFASQAAGSGTGHNNMPPTIIFNKIIFAGRP
jgi:microcystin-dependent protein